MNELLSMRAYVKVVEVGSFAEAARQIGTAKSVVTTRVNQLEAFLQIQLLHRSTRKLTMTDTGLDYYQRCIRLLSDFDEARLAVSSIEWELTGTFRVSCISSFASTYLSNDICNFRLEHPDLNIELQVHDRFCDPVQDVATPEYIEKNGMPRSPEELKTHSFAHNNNVEPGNVVRFSADGKNSEVNLNPVIWGNSAWIVRSAIMQGQCFGMLPIFFIEKELISGELVTLLPELRVTHGYISAYYRKTAFVPMKIKVFLNYLKRKYGEFPPWERRLAEHRPKLKMALGPEK